MKIKGIKVNVPPEKTAIATKTAIIIFIAFLPSLDFANMRLFN